MTGVYNGIIPCILETAIRSVVTEQDFPDTCLVNIENLDGDNQVLNSAYSIIVQSDKECLAMFAKCLEDNKDSSFIAESRIFFNNEVVFYGDLLPAFKELCQKHPQSMYNAAPTCYKSLQDFQISYIIMENLFYYGYHEIDSCKPLQLNLAHLVLQELGKLHALSYAMKDQQPLKFANIVDKIEETLFRDDMRSTFGKLFVHAIHDALKLAKHSLPPGSIYIERLSDFTLNVFDRMISLAKGDEQDEEYKVVTHGDLRNGNIVVRYEDELRETLNTKICLLDYQACRYASPAHDLSFFLFMCLDKTTRDQHRDSLIHTYHTTLCATIEQLGSEPIHIFPMSALKRQLQKNAKFSLALALAGLPMYMDEGAEPNEDNQNEDEEPLDSDIVLQSAREARERKSMKCKNKMMDIIIDAVDQGWL